MNTIHENNIVRSIDIIESIHIFIIMNNIHAAKADDREFIYFFSGGEGCVSLFLFEIETHTEQANHEQNHKHEQKQQQKQETRRKKQTLILKRDPKGHPLGPQIHQF